MTALTEKVFLAMMEYDRGDAGRIQHFTKVYEYASLIGKAEKLEPYAQETLEIAAICHDIGIKLCLKKYGKCPGNLQELEGPPEAEKLLEGCGVPKAQADRVCFLIGHHHTYEGVDGIDWRIILEADFLVNGYEGKCSEDAILKAGDSFYRTGGGKKLLSLMFGI